MIARRALAGAFLLAVSVPPAAAAGWRAEAQAEYLWPTADGRDIRTLSVHALVGRGFFDASFISWRAGVTASYAWGHIIQLDDQFQDVRYENAAGALGPMGLVRLQTPPLIGFSIGGDASGGLLLYTRDFPAGGDIYNFMWRAGLLLEYRVNDDLGVGAGFHVMHVSNGQGLGPQNPSYEGAGPGLWLSQALDSRQ